MNTSRFVSVAIAALVAASLSASASTIHVPGSEPTIQAGIDAASAGDTVLVACGTYYEHDIVMNSGIRLTSETGTPDCVTIDAQQLGRVFYCDDVDATASLVGFTIVGGLVGHDPGGGMYCLSSSLMLTNCAFQGNQTTIGGGGMFCGMSSSPMLTDCTFSDNHAETGGGMYCSSSSPTLTNCTFEGNQATTPGAGGGGMACSNSSPSLTGCTFVGNLV